MLPTEIVESVGGLSTMTLTGNVGGKVGDVGEFPPPFEHPTENRTTVVTMTPSDTTTLFFITPHFKEQDHLKT